MAVIEVREGEGRLVVALGSLNFLVVLAYTLARVARDGFLLSHLPARSLPYVSVALAAFMLLVSAGAGRLTRGASAGQGLARIAVITGVTLLGFSAWFRFGGRATAVAFYLWTGAYGLLLLSQFWSLANEQIDAGQARRLFGLVGAGGVAGGLAAGVAASLVARVLLPADLLIAIAVLHFIVAIVVARGVPRDEGGAAVNSVVDEDLRTALRRPYVRLLVMGSLVGAVTSGVLDYEFKVTVQQRAAGAAGLTALLGLYYGAQNLLALVAQLGLSRLLFARLGARRVGASLPGGVLAGSALTAVAPGLVPVVVTRLFDASMRASVARTSDEFSYFALLDTTRRPVKRFVDGTIARTGDAVAGLLVLAVNATLGGTLTQHALIAAALAALWLSLGNRLDDAYASEVSESLDRMLVGARPAKVSVEEAGAAIELIPLLDDPDERHVAFAMDRLAVIAPDILREKQAQLLEHPSALVRRRALTLPALSAAAVVPAEAAPRRAEIGGRPPSLPASVDGDAEAMLRRLAVRLDDRDVDVRHAAYRSLARAGRRESVPLLIGRLAWPPHRLFAREALLAYGGRIVGALGDDLVDPGRSVRCRREIPRVLADIGTPDAAHALLRAAGDTGDATVMQRTLWALNRIRKRDATVTLPFAVVDRHLGDDTDVYCRLLVRRGAVTTGPDDPGLRLLARALEERSVQCRDRLFRRLALVYPPTEMLRARRGLAGGNRRLRAQALEYLEAVLSVSHRALLVPLLADVPEPERYRLAASRLRVAIPSRPELLRELSAAGDPWLRTCAVFAIGSSGARDLIACAEEALSSPDEKIRQVGAWAHARLAVA